MNSKIFKTIIVLILTALLSQPAMAATIYVDLNVSGGNDDGTSWANAFNEIGEAISDSNTSASEEIWVADGTYTLSSQIDVNKAVYIYGGFEGNSRSGGGETQLSQRDWSANLTVIDGNDSCRCLNVTANATIEGFTVRDGIATNGAGMYNTAAVKIKNCVFKFCYATGYGGGIFNAIDGDAAEVISCVFYSNEADDGGAGIYNDDGSYANAEIVNCLFYYNQTSDGGGGAMYNDAAEDLEITNCTFTGNEADVDGGALYNYNSNAVITNCILWGNTDWGGNTSGEIYNDNDDDPTVSYSCIYGGLNGTQCDGDDSVDGGGNINDNPDFEDYSNPDGNDNIWATSDDGLIPTNNEVVDSGDDDAVPDGIDEDIKGDDRFNGTVDMGAYENQD